MFGKKKKADTAEGTEAVEATETEAVETAEATETAVEEAVAATAEAINEATDALTVPAEDMEMLNRYRTAGEDCVKELGNMEIRKARIIASYGQLENASQQKLMEIGEALGIAEGTGWSVNPDGSVTLHTTAEATATTSEATTSAE